MLIEEFKARGSSGGNSKWLRQNRLPKFELYQNLLQCLHFRHEICLTIKMLHQFMENVK